MTDDEKTSETEIVETDGPTSKISLNQTETTIVGIRFRDAGKIYFFDPTDQIFSVGDNAIVETIRGIEFGSVAIANKSVKISEIVSPLKPVLRKATEIDERKNIQNKQLEENAKITWDDNVKKNNLVMQLVDIEYTFDNAKLIFYFTAEGRVDFRELVKDLASVFRTRIELRQIGVRDEAKLIGGIGVCGRVFCCKSFLSDFAQVSIKMAKEQNLSLSSSKISGTCGRLMCCLRFEQDVYEREYATFPKRDSIVETPYGKGVIVESSFLTGIIKVKLDNDQNAPAKIFAKKEIKVVGRIKSNDKIDSSLLALEDK
ncbi:MAG: stage 0 sporulation family protein [Clostridia bacterium]